MSVPVDDIDSVAGSDCRIIDLVITYCTVSALKQLNYACLMGHIQRNTVLSITDVMLMDGGERTFVIVLAATVLAQSETIIGEPSRFKDGVIVSLSNDLTILNI